ncbi:hypothetical protein HNQ85_000543 [Anoxybacillus calidus]|jgi:hypothetical protein|uniref:Uncharacterized protein n=1 Tax=[Anoxybacillus] calidus TaxID=575178 RepID=A0A7V9YXP3_9BACL|nr:hypothetical protein [Anoxybacillus calidus]
MTIIQKKAIRTVLVTDWLKEYEAKWKTMSELREKSMWNG